MGSDKRLREKKNHYPRKGTLLMSSKSTLRRRKEREKRRGKIRPRLEGNSTNKKEGCPGEETPQKGRHFNRARYRRGGESEVKKEILNVGVRQGRSFRPSGKVRRSL